MSRRPRPKWITLDAFGTLFKYDHVLRTAAEKVVDREHLEVDPKEFYKKWIEKSLAQEWEKHPYKKICEWFELSLTDTFAHFNHKGRVEKGVNINMTLIHEVPLYPDVPEFLDKVHGPYKICLLTNIDNEQLYKVLFRHKLQFDGIITSEMAQAYKPSTEIFDRAFDFIDTQPEEVMHIGDSPYRDVFGAKRAGVQAVWLNRNGEKFPSEIETQPDHTFPSLTETADFLKSLLPSKKE